MMIALLLLGVVILGALTFVLILFNGCQDGSLKEFLISNFDDRPKNGLYRFYEDETWGDGRELQLYRPDSSFIDTTYIPGACFYPASCNMWCLDKDSLISYSNDSDYCYRTLYPVYVHRASGRIDTLHNSFVLYAHDMDIGYIHRKWESDLWFVMESKRPGEILGYSYIVDDAYKNRNPLNLVMMNYSYEGQEKVFESQNSYFWIIQRHTTDIYGPLTEEQLVAQLKTLDIQFPINLRAIYNRYVMPRINDSERSFADLPKPKHFYWPRHKKTKDKVIGP